MPFITKEIYENLIHDNKNIIVSDWPEFDEAMNYKTDEANMSIIMEVIKSIRNIRAEMNVANNKKSRVFLIASDQRITDLLNLEKNFIIDGLFQKSKKLDGFLKNGMILH